MFKKGIRTGLSMSGKMEPRMRMMEGKDRVENVGTFFYDQSMGKEH